MNPVWYNKNWFKADVFIMNALYNLYHIMLKKNCSHLDFKVQNISHILWLLQLWQ